MQRHTKTAALIIIVWVILLSHACRPKPPPPEKQLTPAPTVAAGALPVADAPKAQYAVLISMDGLGAEHLSPLLRQGVLPNFERFIKSGAVTFDARTDVTDTTTMANHTCILTGLPSDPPDTTHTKGFHAYHFNGDPPVDATLHNAGNPALSYIPSIFDVAHDFGNRTCMYAGKSKFVLFSRSFDAENGRPDRIGRDNGRNKLDVAVIDTDADAALLVDRFIADIHSVNPCNLTFFHFATMDAIGHREGWAGPAWNAALVQVDRLLGRMLDAVDASPPMRGKTAVILTADHGGVGTGHGDIGDKRNFSIPFFVMGPEIPKGADLYTLFGKTRTRPGDINPPYGAKRTPIRNGDAGNLALRILGLPPVPGSLMFDMF